MTNAPVLVGGPLLGKRSSFSNKQKDLKSWRTFEPLVTPIIGNENEEQFVLLPSGAFVSVLAYKTGRRVSTFIPFMEKEEIKNGGNLIESACLATYPASSSSGQSVTDALRKLGKDDSSEQEDEQKGDVHVLLVGCQDGTIREFDLSVLIQKQQQQRASPKSCGDYDIPGPCHRPRRVFSVTEKNEQIKHLTAPCNVEMKDGDALVYALSEEKSALGPDESKKSKRTSVHSTLMRVQLPPYNQTEHTGDKVLSLNSDADDSQPRVVIQGSLKCSVGYDKDQSYNNNVPFRLLSVSKKASRTFSSEQEEDRNVFVVVARSNKFYVYHERIKSGETQPQQMQSTSFAVDRRKSLTCISIAPNGADITCGYSEGDICVMSDALSQSLDYFHQASEGKEEPPHPCTTVLTRRMHWHAHPVTSLAYQSVSGSSAVDPILYSGGFESVLVTWQLSRGNYRPADVLPRLAKGGIVHLSSCEGGILVYCEDNSLQSFATHDMSCLWKVQGLASSTGDSLGSSNASVQPTIRADSYMSGSNTLILSGLPSAPGYLHWYDVREQRVTAQLEVAPFNRVSRTERDDSPMPVPSVTNCAFSESGRDLVTIDTMPSENSGIGATERLQDGSTIGVVSTVRFWSWNSTDKVKNSKAGPYSLTAAMTYPHGEENRVTAVAVSKDGQYACTVSNDDNAFRLWHKVLSENANDEDADGKSRRTPVWICKFKVTTPSGYSNFPTGSNAVDFSSDGSILAICYGNMISLWDHKEAALLTSLQHLDEDRSPVESLSFVKTGFLNDLILTRSRSGVTLQNPYGKGKERWSCTLPAGYKEASVTHAELIPSHDSVAVCMTFPKKAQSHVVLLNAVTGVPRMSSQGGETKPLLWELPGTIRSIGAQGRPTKSSNWVNVDAVQQTRPKTKSSPVRLYATMSNGNMLLLSTDGAAQHTVDTVGGVYGKSTSTSTNAPRLNMLKRGGKRKREQAVDALDAPLKKRNAGSIFGTSFGDDDAESAPLPSSDLPALGGAFTRAFVSRNLVSNRQDKS